MQRRMRASERKAEMSDSIPGSFRADLRAQARSRVAGGGRASTLRRMDEALLEQLREQSGLRLDGEGRFWHQGGLVEHARTVQVLHEGVHRAPDGRWATRIGKQWAYLAVDEAAFFVRRLEAETGSSGASLRGWLVGGREVVVAPLSLERGDGDALFLRLPDGERALLLRAAQASLAPLLREMEGVFSVEIGNERFAIGPVGAGGP